jgi:hypothetical protein
LKAKYSSTPDNVAVINPDANTMPKVPSTTVITAEICGSELSFNIRRKIIQRRGLAQKYVKKQMRANSKPVAPREINFQKCDDFELSFNLFFMETFIELNQKINGIFLYAGFW